MTTITAVLVLATLAAAAIDVRTRRIPNLLTGTLALVALAVHVPQGLKLIAGCCGLVSFPGSVSLVLFVLVAGGFLALVTAALRGRLFALVRSTAAVAVHGAPVEKHALPYGVAIAAGSITYAVSTLVPALRLPV